MRGIRSKILTSILIMIVLCVNHNYFLQETDSTTFYFTLEGIVDSGGGTRIDTLFLMREQLAKAGILLKIRNLYWPEYLGEIIAFHDFDIASHALQGISYDGDLMVLYGEDAAWNFGYDTSLDWDEDLGTGKNEWFLREGAKIMPPNSHERIQHYWDWQDYLMDKICPILPTYSPVTFIAHWSNLLGYNATDGIMQSWGKMSWIGLHEGQESINELVIADRQWENLNPLRQSDGASSFISRACMDPLIWCDSDLSVHPHLAESITHINDTHIRIKLREGIKWAADPDNNFTNEYLDVDDVYFTLFVLDKYTSGDRLLPWIEEMIKIDKFTLDIFIDEEPGTSDNELSSRYLRDLSLRIVPEYYLNQTQISDGQTPDVSHIAWEKFANHCFGTGLFEISEYNEGKETILTLNPNCWWLNSSLTSNPDLDWTNRFGDFTSGLNQMRIRIIQDMYSQLDEFEAGKTDIEYVSWNKEKEAAFEIDPRFNLQGTISTIFNYLAFNIRQNRPIIGSRNTCPNDPTMTIGLAVRKAISHAINRVEINNVLNKGKYQLYHSPYSPRDGIWVNPNIIKYDYDLCLAQDFLFKAGYGDIGCTYTTTIGNDIYTLATTSLVTLALVIIYKKRKNKLER